jgi:hypothetical protein
MTDLEDWLEEAITDSIDLDWSPRDAAKLIMSRMQAEGLVLIVKTGPDAELLPCPFCGGEAEMRGHQAPEFWVGCPVIGCKATTDGFDSQERAARAWNTRAAITGRV